MSEISQAIDSIINPDYEIRTNATRLLIQNINDEPSFFMNIFDEYKNSTTVTHAKLCIILLHNIVKKKYAFINSNFPLFSENLQFVILNTKDQDILKLLAGVICTIIRFNNSAWPDFGMYLKLYQSEPNYLPFCVCLFKYSHERSLFMKYSGLLKEIKCDITFQGLQCPDISTQIISSKLFSEFIRTHDSNSELPPEWQQCCEQLSAIAVNSPAFNERDFENFWTAILHLNMAISRPFYDFVKSYLAANSQNLSPNTRSILYHFIINNLKFLESTEYEYFIRSYIFLQLEVEDVDNTMDIFLNFSLIDSKNTYAIFKLYLVGFLQNPDLAVIKVGLTLFDDFLFIYESEIGNDSTFYTGLILSVSKIDDETLFLSLNVFNKLLSNLNYESTLKVIEFLWGVITSCNNSVMQKYAHDCICKVNTSPFFFNIFVDYYMSQSLPFESLPIYFNCVTILHTNEVNLSNVKYETFIDSVSNLFTQSSQKISELLPEGDIIPDDKESQLKLYQLLILRGSAANLILYFSFYDPIKIDSSMANIIIQSFIHMCDFESLTVFDNSRIFGFNDVLYNFASIFMNFKKKSIDLIKPYYEALHNCDCFYYFSNLFACSEPFNKEYCNDLIADFNESFNYFKTGPIGKFELINFSVTTIPKTSKWLYKLGDAQIIKRLFYFMDRVLVLPVKSPQLVEVFAYTLLKFIKPKSIQYNANNPWYPKVIQSVEKMAIEVIVKKRLQSFDHFPNDMGFGYLYLMKIFINLKNDFGHEFLGNIVIPRYFESKQSYENSIMLIFIEMLKNNYFVPDELTFMYQCVKEIIQNKEIEIEVKANSYYILACLSKLNPDVAREFLPMVLVQFKANKDDYNELAAQYSFAVFLLSAVNTVPDEFKPAVGEVLPNIFSYFPLSEKFFMRAFLQEFFTFFEKFSQLSEIEFLAVFSALIRYFAYQQNAAMIFGISDEQNAKLFAMLKTLLVKYCQETNIPNAIASMLPEQPNSVQFILSLLSQS